MSRLENSEDTISEKMGSEITENKILSNNINNVEDEEDSIATMHSAEEELGDHFYIKDEIVNKYKIQIILTNNKIEEMKMLHGKRIIFVSEYDFNTMGDIFRKYIIYQKEK